MPCHEVFGLDSLTWAMKPLPRRVCRLLLIDLAGNGYGVEPCFGDRLKLKFDEGRKRRIYLFVRVTINIIIQQCKIFSKRAPVTGGCHAE